MTEKELDELVLWLDNTEANVKSLEEQKRIILECKESCQRAGDTQTMASYDKSIHKLNSKIQDINNRYENIKHSYFQIINLKNEKDKLEKEKDVLFEHKYEYMKSNQYGKMIDCDSKIREIDRRIDDILMHQIKRELFKIRLNVNPQMMEKRMSHL
jgi:hypothetical protein